MKPVAQPSATNAIAENLKGWRDEHQGILNQISDGLKALERLEADRRQPQSDDRLRAIESDVQLERTKIARARHELQRAGERWSREIEKATRAAATQAEQRFNEWVETDYNVAARAYGASIRRGLALASGAGRPVPGFEHMRVVAAEPPERGTLNSLNLIGPKLLIPDLANWQAEPSAAALAAPVLDLK
ncbi:MAG: hypothetical protein ABSC08_05255, partial [Bryobacteraceae bacterium]